MLAMARTAGTKGAIARRSHVGNSCRGAFDARHTAHQRNAILGHRAKAGLPRPDRRRCERRGQAPAQCLEARMGANNTLHAQAFESAETSRRMLHPAWID